LSEIDREGMIAREEAVARLEREGAVPWEPVRELCVEIGVDPAELGRAAERLRERVGSS
jgi:hypothetical protein